MRIKTLFLNKRQKYNNIKQRCKRLFKKTGGSCVSKLAKISPQSFWRNVRTQYRQPVIDSSHVSMDDMYVHFSNLYGTLPTNENVNNGTQDFEIIYDYDVDLDLQLQR